MDQILPNFDHLPPRMVKLVLIDFRHAWWHSHWTLMGATVTQLLKRGIKLLRGPNFTQFWPPTLLEWTIGNNFHNTYSLLTWPSVDFLLTTYSPLRSYWMPPKICVIYVALYIYYIIMAQCKIHTLFFAFGNLIAKQFYNYVF